MFPIRPTRSLLAPLTRGDGGAARLAAALTMWGAGAAVCAGAAACAAVANATRGAGAAGPLPLLVALPIAPKGAASLRLNAAHWVAEVFFPTLRAWAAARPRPPPRMVAVFAA
eukprot:gene36693-39052_t